MTMMFQGLIKRARSYPIVLPAHYIYRQYRREQSYFGRLLNDLEYLTIKWIFR